MFLRLRKGYYQWASCLQSFPASGAFPVSQFFTLGQSIGVSTSASVVLVNIQDWFPLGWTGWISCSPRNSQESFPTPQFKSINSLLSCFYSLTLTSYMTTRKIIALTRQTFVNKIMSLLFHMLSRLVITFLPRSKCLLISWLQSLSAVILEPPKIKSVIVSIVSPSIYHEVMGPDAMILVFWMLTFKPDFYSPLHIHQEALYFLFDFCH